MLPFIISTVTRILLHVTSIFIILKSIIKCCNDKRARSGAKSSASVSASSVGSQAQGDSLKPDGGPPRAGSTGPGASGTQTALDANVPAARSLPEDGTQFMDEKEKEKENEKNKGKNNDKSPRFLPYPSVKTPSPSVKKRRSEELERDKREKIAKGFYQERSDEDDTLEKVKSLKMEQSEAASRKASARMPASMKKKRELSKHGDSEAIIVQVNSSGVDVQNCDAWELLAAEDVIGAVIMPRLSAVLEQYRLRRASFEPLFPPLLGAPRSSTQFRKKRQSTGYVPTDNIYGYDYSSSSSNVNPARLIVNPNYYYLNDELTTGYAKNYVQAEMNYGGSAASGTVPQPVRMNDAILSNEQQNSMNYQQIQQNLL
ncbi:hypothetical protein Aduo_017395 [Ancylostoma duodenale]